MLAEKFFPSANQVTSNKRMPDYDYIRKELLRNGVSKKLLWTEYMEDCRANGEEPLMYSQFCYHSLIRNAGFDQPEASIMDINYTSGRKLNKDLINRLATCEYISEYRNLFITGATGCGKTYMACAFGMEACKQYYNTRYVRMPDLLMDLDIARTEGNYRKVMAKCSNPVLLILDEWMPLKPTDTEQKDIFELLHRRRKKSSTIFCSQYVFEEWYDQFGGEDSPLVDAIIDRIAHDSYQINITSINAEHDRSMREVYGLDKSMRE